MDNYKKELIHFIETAKGFDNSAKLKLILFSAGVKPVTYVSLKINPKNLEEKYNFEKHLQNAGIFYEVSRARSYEEIDKISGNKIFWKIKGTWYGYDIFKNESQRKLFKKYVVLAGKNHKQADILGGKVYGYPKCCTKMYSNNHSPEYVADKYSYFDFYKRLNDIDRAFPFLVHTSCSTKCASSRKLNSKYAQLLRRIAPKFYSEFSKRKIFTADLVVDSESDIFKDTIFETRPVWLEKDGHEYTLLCLKKIDGHHYFFTNLTRNWYAKGAVLEAKVSMQYDYADIEIKKVKGYLKDMQHKRRILT
ncbi:MAG: hypothetical protein AABX39_05710 [Nanoarchaeota archaeon]